MRPYQEILSWIRGHGQRLKRPDYEPPNHLAGGEVRFFGSDIGATFALRLDASGNAPDYRHDPPPSRIEVYDAAGALLYAEDA